jgi:hypothetical protein
MVLVARMILVTPLTMVLVSRMILVTPPAMVLVSRMIPVTPPAMVLVSRMIPVTPPAMVLVSRMIPVATPTRTRTRTPVVVARSIGGIFRGRGGVCCLRGPRQDPDSDDRADEQTGHGGASNIHGSS